MTSKKTFIGEIENPAELFITKQEKEVSNQSTEGITTNAPEGYKINPLYIEKRSRRLQLLIQPSLYKKLKARAIHEGKSVNDVLHNILEEALKER